MVQAEFICRRVLQPNAFDVDVLERHLGDGQLRFLQVEVNFLGEVVPEEFVLCLALDVKLLLWLLILRFNLQVFQYEKVVLDDFLV